MLLKYFSGGEQIIDEKVGKLLTKAFSNTNNEYVRQFSRRIYRDVAPYVEAHRSEYQDYLTHEASDTNNYATGKGKPKKGGYQYGS